MCRVESTDHRRFFLGLAIVLALGLALRILYLVAQPESDPFYDRPFLDGAIYVDWGKAILASEAETGEAFYLAPLYPHFLALVFAVAGEGLGSLFLVQQLLSLATAAGVGWIAYRLFGTAAGVASAFLFAFHHPLLFFASTPMGETLALALLVAGLWTGLADTRARTACGGFLIGLASLARPNFLLVAAAFVGSSLLGKRWVRAGLLAGGTALAVLPITVRNFVESGHPVLISSNGGITWFHGNGPGATGGFVRPAGFSGEVATQREEATTIARARTEDPTLDHVEADGWWGRRGWRTRFDDPGGSFRLLAWRSLLLVDNFEHSLDYDPALDADPWRPVLRLGTEEERPSSGFEVAFVPFAALFGLTAAALVLFGIRGTGGWRIWGPVLACAATPILFYASSRYRLATSALLTLPAGVGLAGLLGLHTAVTKHRRFVASIVALAAVLVSCLVPSEELQTKSRSFGLSNRAGILTLAGEFESAEMYARMAVDLSPNTSAAHHNLAYLLTQTGRSNEAMDVYARAVALDPRNADSAANLALLLIQDERPGEAEPILRRAVQARPSHAPSWQRLVRVLRLLNRNDDARDAIRAARARGVTVR